MAISFRIPNSLIILPQNLSTSEKNITSKPNFNLQLRNPILAQLENCTNMHHLHQLHSHMTKSGLINDSFALSRLLVFCALSFHGDLNYAMKLFKQVQRPNLFIWNAMIRALSRSNHPEICFHMYADMLSSDIIIPDSYTFPFLIKSCLNISGVFEGKQVHAHAVKYGLEFDYHVMNSLINFYSEMGQFDMAFALLNTMDATYEIEVPLAIMIGGLISNDKSKEAVELFLGKDWRKLKLDQVTFATVLSACANVKNLKLGKEIHCYIEENHVEMSLILSNSLMNMYAKCGEYEVTRTLFDNMHEKDGVSWNVLITGYVEYGYFEEGIKLFSEMKDMNIKANEATLLSLISNCHEVEQGKVVHGYINQIGFQAKTSICNSLINMYARIGYNELGREIFDNMREKDTITWNSMINGYAQCGSMDTARSLFDQMPKKDNFSLSTIILGYVRCNKAEEAIGIYKELVNEVDGLKLDRVTLISILSACSSLGALEEGKYIDTYIENNEIKIDAYLGTALIDMYSKCGCIDSAMKIFKEVKERDVFTWTAMISGLALNGRGEEALRMFRKLPMKPNSVTFLSALSACVHCGLVNDGIDIYRSMVNDHKIEPEMSHLGCMVDILGRAGLLEEALDFIKRLRCKVDASVWGALLGACRIHGNTKVAEIAMKKMVELEPKHEGAHVILSNIYAEAGEWKEKKEMRKKMKDANIKKKVGASWIELNGNFHEFAAGDNQYKSIQ